MGINRNYVTATHFSTKLLVDPTAFHTSMAIADLDKDKGDKEEEEDLGLADLLPKGRGKGRLGKGGKVRMPKSK